MVKRSGEFGGGVRDGSATAQERFIVVEGPIGVGKTELAKKLAEHYDCGALLEQTAENPFLERFYRSGHAAALPTQLFFLFQRAAQIEELKQSDLFRPIRIADFMLDKDRLFASINLDRDEYALYGQVFEKMAIEQPVVDLVVYLQAPVDVLLARIARRGIDYEALIDRVYLEQLSDAYARFFYEYDASPLLIVNAASIDPIHNSDDFGQLVAQIDATSSGRHFFNPVAAALA
ncbi:MAG: deoxynucleoside kinase [Pseudomonadota bacterium]